MLATTSGSLHLARRVLGFCFLGIGIAGVLLPIIPGWPGFFVAIILLGRRDPALRRLHLVGRRILRRLRTARTPHLRRLGRWLSDQYVGMRRSMRPHIIRAEKIFHHAQRARAA
ncbi:MAG: hypothetical protein HGA65_19190 [Oscillochloris sp.]|nr:hypothetical protein [Oscillochloris sp.]